MSRLIDADKLLEGIAELKQSPWFNSKYGYADRKEAVEAVEYLCIKKEPTIDAKPMWIPCSERLPEENGRYLVTNSAWGVMEVDWNAWVNGAWLYPNTKPIAWMPLPEPYKGGDTE